MSYDFNAVRGLLHGDSASSFGFFNDFPTAYSSAVALRFGLWFFGSTFLLDFRFEQFFARLELYLFTLCGPRDLLVVPHSLCRNLVHCGWFVSS